MLAAESVSLHLHPDLQHGTPGLALLAHLGDLRYVPCMEGCPSVFHRCSGYL